MSDYTKVFLALMLILGLGVFFALTPSPFPQPPVVTFDVVRWDGKELVMHGNNCQRMSDWFTCDGESVKVISVKAR